MNNNNSNNAKTNKISGNHTNKAYNKGLTIEDMDAAFERAERGLEFAMANNYREEISKKRKTCDDCMKSINKKGQRCVTCGTPGNISDMKDLTLVEVWNGLESMCQYADKKENDAKGNK